MTTITYQTIEEALRAAAEAYAVQTDADAVHDAVHDAQRAIIRLRATLRTRQ
jgi:hypothetical protein